MKNWLARVVEWSLNGFFHNYSSALRYYAPGCFEAANNDWEEQYYG